MTGRPTSRFRLIFKEVRAIIRLELSAHINRVPIMLAERAITISAQYVAISLPKLGERFAHAVISNL
jgi:hypothetical protein